MSKKKGFTLVELMAVIVIISILLIILVPSISHISEKSKISMKTSKIDVIKTAAEKYGNEEINTFQNCTGELNANELKEKCSITIKDLIKYGFLEADKEDIIVDPITNKALEGKALLCYNPAEIKIYASYVDDENFACATVDLVSGNSLSLGSSKGSGYIGGKPLTINIISSGAFRGGFECTSSASDYATCEIEDKKLKLNISNNRDLEFDLSGFKEVKITVTGKYLDEETNSLKSLTKEYTLNVYPTSLNIPSKGEYCMSMSSTEEIALETLNSGNITVETTDPEILIGTAKDNKITLSSGTKGGPATLTITENIGGNRESITRNVYSFEVELPNDNERRMGINTTKKIPINSKGAGVVTVRTDNKDVMMLEKNGEPPAEVITLNDDDTEFTVIAKNTGTAKITISPDTCGKSEEAEFTVINMSLKNSELTTYAGSTTTLTNDIIVENPVNLTCTSSNEEAARCEVENTTLKIIPGNTSDEDVTISVSSPLNGFASMKVHVLPTTIAIENKDGNQINYVCSEAGIGNNSEEVYVKGQNINGISTIKDDYIIDANIEGQEEGENKERRQVYVSNANVTSTPPSPYKIGYNTGKTTLTLKENRGNKQASLDYYIYSLNIIKKNKEDNNGVDTIKAGQSTSFDVESSIAGEISVTIDKPEVAKVSITGASNYQEGINVINKRTVNIQGLSMGEAEITVKGSYCGEKKYKIKVEESAFKVYFQTGTYTDAVQASVVQCSTTGSATSCEIEIPTMSPKEGFQAIGFSRTKDSRTAEYQVGDKLTINDANTGMVLYANSTENRKPTCQFSNINPSYTIGNEMIIDLECIDLESGFKEDYDLNSTNFDLSNSNASITNITKEEIEKGYLYHINLQPQKKGLFKMSLKSHVLEDKFDNFNDSSSFTNVIITDRTEEAIDIWTIGKVNADDVLGAIYDNGAGYTLDLIGSNEIQDYLTGSETNYAPWYYDFFGEITTIEMDDNITNISNYLFYALNKIENLKISKNIKTIGDYAFNNTGIKSIELPNGLISIGDNAFSYHNFKSIEIPASVETIGPQAFLTLFSESKLANITFQSGSKLKTIKQGAFGQHKAESITIPASVETIEPFAFQQERTTLRSVTFEENSILKTIGDYAFAGGRLTKFNIPATIESLGNYAISILEGIESFPLGANLKEFGETAVTGKNLTNFTIDEANPYFTVENGILYNKDKTELVRCPDGYVLNGTDINIPETVTIFREGAFNAVLHYEGINTGPAINIPSTISNLNLGNNFQGFTLGSINLSNETYESQDGILFSKDKGTIYLLPTAYKETTYTIPDTVTSIHKYFGYMNFKVKTITIPASIKVASSNAFTTDSKYAFQTIRVLSEDEFTDDIAFALLDFDNTGYSPRNIFVKNETIKNHIDENYEGLFPTLTVTIE